MIESAIGEGFREAGRKNRPEGRPLHTTERKAA